MREREEGGGERWTLPGNVLKIPYWSLSLSMCVCVCVEFCARVGRFLCATLFYYRKKCVGGIYVYVCVAISIRDSKECVRVRISEDKRSV